MIIAETELTQLPESCEECELMQSGFPLEGECPFTGERFDYEEVKHRSSGCPLREVNDQQFKKVYHDTRQGQAAKACGMCINAMIDPELTEENDLSFHGIGSSDEGFRIMMQSGWGKPVQLLFERWIAGEWHLVGVYEPNFCPNCGRELTEYRKKSKAVEHTAKAPLISLPQQKHSLK